MKFITTITTTSSGIYVDTTVKGLDHTDVCGWGLGPKHGMLAKRLKAAIDAGKVLKIEGVRTDVNGLTYLSTTSSVLARTLNADLKRLGF